MDSQDMPDLTGKVAVVTGSNRGLGFHTIKHLATHGAKVYCGTRSKEKFDKAQQQLMEENPDFPQERLVFLKLDVGNIESVLDAVKEVKAGEKSVHFLINSAGMVLGRPTEDSEWDDVMAVVYIGHFVLTNGLRPLLKAACEEKDSDVRVISVASNAPGIFLPKNFKFDFTTPTSFYQVVSYYPWRWRFLYRFIFDLDMVHYSIAKTATLLFTKELQRRFDEENIPILCLSLNPGGVATDNVESIMKPLFRPLLRSVQVTPDQGSYNSLFAATAKEPRQNYDKFKGNYLEPIGVITLLQPVMNDEKQSRRLWDVTITEVNKYVESHGLGSSSFGWK